MAEGVEGLTRDNVWTADPKRVLAAISTASCAQGRWAGSGRAVPNKITTNAVEMHLFGSAHVYYNL